MYAYGYRWSPSEIGVKIRYKRDTGAVQLIMYKGPNEGKGETKGYQAFNDWLNNVGPSTDEMMQLALADYRDHQLELQNIYIWCLISICGL